MAPIPGRFVIDPSSVSFAEDVGEVDLVVTREFGKFGDADITIVTAAETASAGEDYGTVNILIPFADGEFGSKPVSVRILDDQDVEGDETFLMELTNPTGGTSLGIPSSTQLTIVDNDSGTSADVNLEDPTTNSYDLVTPTTATLGAVTVEFPLRFEVQARVHNNGPDDARDIKVEIRMPKIALAAFDVVDMFPDSGGTPDLRFDDNCTFAPRVDPDPNDDDDPNADFVFIRCTYAGPLSAGETLRVPADPILVGYAETVRTDNITPPLYFADDLQLSSVVFDPDHRNNTTRGAPSWSAGNSGGGATATASKGGGVMSLPLLLLFAGLGVRRQRLQ
jgi:Calx-beta domain-containing protein